MDVERGVEVGGLQSVILRNIVDVFLGMYLSCGCEVEQGFWAIL